MTSSPGPSPVPPPPADADERAQALEFERFAQTQDALDVEAALWAVRRRRGLSAQDREELERWLAADPRHGAALEDMDDTFGRLEGLPDAEARALRAGLSDPAPPQGAPTPMRPTPAAPPRRRWLAAWGRLAPPALALGLAAAGWIAWDAWRAQPSFEKHYATAHGQQLRVSLPDGSRIDLDTATELTVRLGRTRREVRLAEGQALFGVAHDAQHPFTVDAGATRVTVVGTQFVVRHTRAGLDEGDTRVAVEQGRVRVARVEAGGAEAVDGAVELSPGQAVLADARGRVGRVLAVAQGEASAWRDGRVSFENTPLSQALAEFGRYGATQVVVRDPAVGALRVGGSYNLRNFSGFLRALPEQLPVQLVPRDGEVEVVRRH